jgi:hypothetical protein
LGSKWLGLSVAMKDFRSQKWLLSTGEQMKNTFKYIILSTLFVAGISAQALERDGGQIEGEYYRCQAIGKTEKGFVEGENENSLLKYAQLGALRACRQKGGHDCRINHCFRMRTEIVGDE